MSQENIRLAYEAMDAFNRRDLAAYLALMDPEVEFTPYEVWVQGGQPYRGHAGIRNWWNDTFEVLPDLKVEVYEVRDLKDRAFVHGRLRGQGAGSGAPIERTMWLAIEWRKRMEVWWCAFGSEAEALTAVGLEE
jgi:ketosteroid isomerase-like protein